MIIDSQSLCVYFPRMPAPLTHISEMSRVHHSAVEFSILIGQETLMNINERRMMHMLLFTIVMLQCTQNGSRFWYWKKSPGQSFIFKI